MAIEFVIKADHSAEVLEELKQKIELALDVCGAHAVSHTQTNLERDVYSKSGVSWYKRNSHLKDFSHKVVMGEKAVYVGTNVKYAA